MMDKVTQLTTDEKRKIALMIMLAAAFGPEVAVQWELEEERIRAARIRAEVEGGE